LKRLSRNREIVRAFEREGTEVREAAHQDDIENAEVEGRVRFLRDKRNAARDVAPRRRPEWIPAEEHRAGARREHPAEHLQQGRLAGAIRSDHADEIAAIDRERHLFQNPLAPSVRERDLIGSQQP
jgi:hypothetical protein